MKSILEVHVDEGGILQDQGFEGFLQDLETGHSHEGGAGQHPDGFQTGGPRRIDGGRSLHARVLFGIVEDQLGDDVQHGIQEGGQNGQREGLGVGHQLGQGNEDVRPQGELECEPPECPVAASAAAFAAEGCFERAVRIAVVVVVVAVEVVEVVVVAFSVVAGDAAVNTDARRIFRVHRGRIVLVVPSAAGISPEEARFFLFPSLNRPVVVLDEIVEARWNS